MSKFLGAYDFVFSRVQDLAHDGEGTRNIVFIAVDETFRDECQRKFFRAERAAAEHRVFGFGFDHGGLGIDPEVSFARYRHRIVCGVFGSDPYGFEEVFTRVFAGSSHKYHGNGFGRNARCRSGKVGIRIAVGFFEPSREQRFCVQTQRAGFYRELSRVDNGYGVVFGIDFVCYRGGSDRVFSDVFVGRSFENYPDVFAVKSLIYCRKIGIGGAVSLFEFSREHLGNVQGYLEFFDIQGQQHVHARTAALAGYLIIRIGQGINLTDQSVISDVGHVVDGKVFARDIDLFCQRRAIVDVDGTEIGIEKRRLDKHFFAVIRQRYVLDSFGGVADHIFEAVDIDRKLQLCGRDHEFARGVSYRYAVHVGNYLLTVIVVGSFIGINVLISTGVEYSVRGGTEVKFYLGSKVVSFHQSARQYGVKAVRSDREGGSGFVFERAVGERIVSYVIGQIPPHHRIGIGVVYHGVVFVIDIPLSYRIRSGHQIARFVVNGAFEGEPSRQFIRTHQSRSGIGEAQGRLRHVAEFAGYGVGKHRDRSDVDSIVIFFRDVQLDRVVYVSDGGIVGVKGADSYDIGARIRNFGVFSGERSRERIAVKEPRLSGIVLEIGGIGYRLSALTVDVARFDGNDDYRARSDGVIIIFVEYDGIVLVCKRADIYRIFSDGIARSSLRFARYVKALALDCVFDALNFDVVFVFPVYSAEVIVAFD